MGIFNLFKKKKKAVTTSKTILSMIMFNDLGSYSVKKMLNDLEENWNLTTKKVEGEGESTVLKIEGQTIAIMTVDKPIPWSDIAGTGKYAYNWEGWENELRDHSGHVIVSILSSEESQMNRYLILTKLLCSILQTSNALGVYNGTQSLLTPREYFIKAAQGIKQQALPVELWVYTGFHMHENGLNLYTVGLKTFGKRELEIIDSQKTNEELYSILHNLIFYLIAHNTQFSGGHTFALPNGEPAKVEEVQGIHNNEIVHKLVF